jgi:hypothetical protein
MRSAVVAVIVAVGVVLATSTLPWTEAEASNRSDVERAAFEKLSQGLIEQLAKREPRTIAIIPFLDRDIPVLPTVGRLFNNHLRSALIDKAGERFEFVAREELEHLIRDLVDTGELDPADSGALNIILKNVSADLRLIGSIERIGGSLSVTYKALDTKGHVLANATPQELPWSSDYIEDHDAVPLSTALAEGARVLADKAHDMKELRLGGVRFQNTGWQTQFSDYFEVGLSDNLRNEFENPLSNKKLRVTRIGLSSEDMDNMRGGAGDFSSGLFNPPEGTYTLTGEYWVHPGIVEIRINLTGKDGALGWTGYVDKTSVPNTIRLRPDGDFGDWQEYDGLGPIRFELSSDKGPDPSYEVDEHLNLAIRTDRNVWLYCYYLQQDGAVFQIFPNPKHKDPRISGGPWHTIPGKTEGLGYDFILQILPPIKPELVKCFAVGEDISSRLPPEFDQDKWGPLPDNMKYDLPSLFRRMGDVVMTEASLVINKRAH